MIHEQVGHLGIFVSSSIARREHTEVSSTLETIEALAPGLYEMIIEDIEEENGEKKFTVDFVERTIDDIRAIDDGLDDERPFAAVARTSEVQAQIYDAVMRPFVKALVTPTSAEFSRALHPKRLERALASSRNPAMAPVEKAAEALRENRRKAAPDNPFIAAENLWFDAVEQSIDFLRDTRDMLCELSFFTMWSTPWARRFGSTHEARRTLARSDELRSLPEVSAALLNVDRGGFPEAVIRMLILLAGNRGNVRRDRLERSSKMLTRDEPFASLGAERRAMIIHEQTLIVTYEPQRAIETLPLLLRTPEERLLAMRVVQFVPGQMSEMSADTVALLQHFRELLDLPPADSDILEDPLDQPEAQDTLAQAVTANVQTAQAADFARGLDGAPSTAREEPAQVEPARESAEESAGPSPEPVPDTEPDAPTARKRPAARKSAPPTRGR